MNETPIDYCEMASVKSLMESFAKTVRETIEPGNPIPRGVVTLMYRRAIKDLPDFFTYRNVARMQWSGLVSVADVKRACLFLESRGFANVICHKPKVGRPSYEVVITESFCEFLERHVIPRMSEQA